MECFFVYTAFRFHITVVMILVETNRPLHRGV